VLEKGKRHDTLKKIETAAAAMNDGELEVSDLIAVGSEVELGGLSNGKFNGRKGVVITKKNADGRYGVRLATTTDQGSSAAVAAAASIAASKPILIKEANLTAVQVVAAAAGAAGVGEDDQAGAAAAKAKAELAGALCGGAGGAPGGPGAGVAVDFNFNFKFNPAGRAELVGLPAEVCGPRQPSQRGHAHYRGRDCGGSQASALDAREELATRFERGLC